MLLLLAASLVLCAREARADTGAEEANPAATAMLLAAAGSERDAQRAAKAAQIDAPLLDADGSGLVTAADAALYLRYQAGWLSACGAAQTHESALTASEDAIHRLTQTLFMPDFAALDARMRGTQSRQYRTYAQNADAFADAAFSLERLSNETLGSCMAVVSRDLRALSLSVAPAAGVVNAPNWKQLAALYYVFGDRTADALRAGFTVALADSSDGGKTLTASFLPFDGLASFGTSGETMQCKLANAYLNTVYDEAGVAVLREKSRYTSAYLSTLTNPLPGCLIKNCWYDPRDKGTRLHVGADIQAPARTHILSVTDGTVLAIGYLPVPGNYVVVRDPFGYEYHYYHMFEQSKLVEVGDAVISGDAIGRVGNTGNSASDHLHLSVVSPEYAYVNPYDLFLQAGFEPIRLEG